MKKLKIFALAAVVAFGLAACSQEENPNDPNRTLGDGKAQVGFSFRLPNAAFTRADQDASDPDEITIERVSVFVFDESGVPASLNPYTTFNNTFDNTPEGGIQADEAFETGTAGNYTTYSLKDAYMIETNSGTAHIYVAVNLPASLDHAYASENALLEAKSNANNDPATDDVLDGEGFAEPGEFTMFGQALNGSNGVAIELAEIDQSNTEPTQVNVTVERVVSKVVGTTKAATFQATQEGATTLAKWGNDVQLEYTIESFNVYQEMSDSYLSFEKDRSVWGSLYNNDAWSYFKNKGAVSGWLGTNPGKNIGMTVFAQDNGPSDDLTDLSGFYVGENYSNKNPNFQENASLELSRNGYTTYAMVATKVTSNKVATWDAGTNYIKWDAPALGARTNPNNDLIVMYIPDEVEPLIVEGTTIADAIYAGLNAKDAVKYNNTTIKQYVYYESYVHFLVWLNKDGFNDYNIGRNEFIHVHVTGVTGSSGQDLNNDDIKDGIFPGYPGDEEDPEKPTDLEDEDNNPEPLDPEDPIEGFSAKLQVIITVKDWVYRLNGGILK
jgi:hypothetical protein